jgi:GAF domain-containing protein
MPPSLEEDIAQVLASVVEAEHELQQQYADFESLNKITKSINRTLELEEILQAVVEQTRPMLQADAAWIYLLDEKKQLEMRAHAGLSAAYVRGMRRLQQGDGLEGWVVSENRTRFVEAITSDSKTYKIWVDKEGLQTLVAAPIALANQEERKEKTEPQVEGVLVAGRRAGHTRSWNMREVNLLSAIADHLAPTIHNTRVHAQIRESETSLKAGNQVLQEVNEMLIKKNVRLEEFIHRELEPALADMQSVLKRLLEDESSTLSDELNGDVANLHQTLIQLSRLARGIL